ncbi:MAG: hypothetical protein ACOY3K_08545 [Candidatus Omnitrophota bacterium]
MLQILSAASQLWILDWQVTLLKILSYVGLAGIVIVIIMLGLWMFRD